MREFYNLELEVTPAVLIPRPETEMIVEAALPLLVRTLDARVADVGTGCGNIAVTLAHEARRSTVVATDVSGDALAVAKRNAARHGVVNRIEFVQTPYLDGVEGPFDLIAANPPYVREIDRGGLSPTVLHEPAVALFGGANGMRDIEGVLEAAVAKLRDGRLADHGVRLRAGGRRARARRRARRPAPRSRRRRPAGPAAHRGDHADRRKSPRR